METREYYENAILQTSKALEAAYNERLQLDEAIKSLEMSLELDRGEYMMHYPENVTVIP